MADNQYADINKALNKSLDGVSNPENFRAVAEAKGAPAPVQQMQQTPQAEATQAIERAAADELAVTPEAAPMPAPQQQVQYQAKPTATEAYAAQSINNINKASAGEEKAYNQINTELSSPEYIKNEQQRLDKVKQIQTDLEGFKKKYNEIADQKIDPNAYWANKSSGQKFLAGIGMAFGALGASIDGRNRAVEVINDAIKTDIDAQKANMESKFQNLKGQENLYKQMLDIYKDPELAQTAATLTKMKQAQNTIAMYSTKVKNEPAKAAALNVLGDIEKGKLALEAKFASKRAEQIQANTEYSSQHALNAPKDLKETAIPLPNGRVGYGFDKKSAEDYKTVFKEYKNASNSIDKLTSYIGTGAATDLKKRGEIEVLRTNLVGGLRLALLGPGVMTPEERKLVENVVADPSSLTTKDSTTSAKYKTLKNIMKRSLISSAQAAGYDNAKSFGDTSDTISKLGLKPTKK